MPWYFTIEIGYAWITGYKPYRYWANTTACFDRMTNFTFHERHALAAKLDSDIPTYDKIEATLFTVRNMSSHLWYCNSAWQGFNYFWWGHFQQFKSFGHVFLSLLQNFLGNVISITNLYLSLEEKMI